MKKKILVIIAAILFISSFSACDDKKQQVKDDNYSLVNYTDTGESASSMNSKTADIEHSTVSSDVTFESEEVSSPDNSDTAKTPVSENSKSVSSASSKNTVSTVSNTVNTITYYYEEIDTENSTSQTSSEVETDSDVPSEPDTDSDDSSNTDISSTPSDFEEPVTVGSYTAEDIAFYYNGEKIYLGDSIDSVFNIIGEPDDTEENVYYYNGITVTTSSENGSEAYVDSLQFFLKDFSTEKGITIGAAYEDVIKAYGNSNTVVNDEHRYYVGNEYMYFDIQNNIVANIGYRIDREVEIDSNID